MQKRRVLKKGRIVFTRKGSFVLRLADRIVKIIKPYCRRIEIVGSIRRKEQNPVDIDIVLIPKNKQKVEELLRNEGKFLWGGEQKVGFKINGVKTELYYTVPEELGAALLAYSSRTGSSIGLRIIARLKGFKLNQHGLFRKGKRVAGKTEEEIYHALGREYKKPEER